MSEDGATFAEGALEAMLELIDEGALLFEANGNVCVAASRRAASILGMSEEAILGRPRDEVLTGLSAADEVTVRAIAELRDASEEDSLERTVTLRMSSGRTFDWASTPVFVGEALAGRLDVLTERTTEQQLREALAEARAKLAETALLDELTGLVNRRYFAQQIDREHRRAQRAWTSYAIARIDVDGMKTLNDELGTEEGDRLLRRLGEELKAPRREYDLVGRWENDELVMLLPGIDEQAVKAVVGRSIAAMRDAARALTGREVTFCTGIALWVPPSMVSAEDIVTRAGTALEAAKLMGPGSMEVDATPGNWDWKDDPPQV
jgi:diguanylate cyclase (GGDEF)-like protein